jgi:hypothetical protein
MGATRDNFIECSSKIILRLLEKPEPPTVTECHSLAFG